MKQGLLTFIKQHRAECVCFALFIVLAVIGFCVHEASYDETQAWMIAKTASWKEIWRNIPVYEGHPPFWHTLLALPAKSGVPWHIACGVLGLSLMLVNGFLLFFKAPFPRWVRCLLPFSYFLFYQYGIIVRPYSVIFLLVLLLAIYFPQRNMRPGLFVGLLAGLCACHVFGMAIACGITLAWLWEIKDHRPWKQYIPALCKDKRFHKMLLLLGWTLLVVAITFIPREHPSAALMPSPSRLKQILYVFLATPAEAVLTDFSDAIHIMTSALLWGGLLRTALLGLLLLAGMLLYLPKKNILYFVLPYLCVGTIMVFYASCHHIGLMLLLAIWYFWINLSAQSPSCTWPEPVKLLAKVMLTCCLLVPIGWSAHVLYLDYTLPIFPGKDMVAFLKRYHLEDELIFAAWLWKPQETNEKIVYTNPNIQPFAVMLNMYLDHNIVANFHDGENKGYLDNYAPSDEEIKQTFFHWWEKGLPSVLLNATALPYLYNNMDLIKEYFAAYTGVYYTFWKFNPPHKDPQVIYLYRPLWEKYEADIRKTYAPDPATDISAKTYIE